ncbi:MAG: YidC/Oxa1 family insertase periplasmic-domain containing protein [Planctomycetes bacterium]|nr:YidC/Oxa1 family insertase periplasmic-domain containing protein [Planctomycetota bacterium]
MNRETIIRWVAVAAVSIAILWGFKYVEPHLPLPRTAPKAPAGKAPSEKPAATAEKPPAEKAPAEKPPAEKAPAEKPPAEKPGPEKPPAVQAPVLAVVGAAEAAGPIVLGSDLPESDFDVMVEVTPVGAGVRRLALARRQYFKTVGDQRKPPDERAAMELVEPTAPLPAFLIPELRVHLKGAEEWAKVDLSQAAWRVVESGPAQAVLAVDVCDAGGKKVLEVCRTYKVLPRANPAEPGAAAPPQYELRMNLSVAAADDRVEKVAYLLSGPPALPLERGRGAAPAAVAATWASGGVKIAQAVAKDISKTDALPATANLAAQDVVWAGEMDKYFAVVLIPQKPSREGTFIAAAETVWYRLAHDRYDSALAGVRLISKELPLAAGKPIENEFLIYAGPKDAGLLEKYYSDVGLEKLIVWAMPCCFIPLPGLDYLSRFLAAAIETLHDVIPPYNYGIAIILLVVALRVTMHPVTRWSTKSMMAMQKLQPEMERIRKEFAHDKERMQQEMAKIGGLKSMTGCLPMFFQMPIWIALYGALGAAIQLRHAPLVPASWLPEGSMFLQDLSAPDALVHWNTPFYLPGIDLPLIGWVLDNLAQKMLAGGSGGITSFNLLPVLVGVSFYLQQKMTPQPAAATPQMEQQRKMMSVMMIFFAVLMYGLPSGLCLYISASSFLGFFEQRYLKKRMAAATAVAVAAPQAGGGEPPTAPPRPAPEQSLVAGRDKSPAERLQAWIRRHIAPAEDKPDPRRGKGRKGR